MNSYITFDQPGAVHVVTFHVLVVRMPRPFEPVSESSHESAAIRPGE
jgi:hypothetical protein